MTAKRNKKNNKNSKDKLVTKNQVISMLRSQKNKTIKFTDVIHTPVLTNQFIADVTLPIVGVGQSASIGEKFVLNRIDFRMEWKANTLATALPTQCRVLVVQSMFPQTATPALTVGDVIQQNGATTWAAVSPLNYEGHNKQYRLLLDETFLMNPFDFGSGYVKRSFKPSIKDIMFEDTSNTYQQGAITAFYLLNSAANWASASTYDPVSYFRVWFSDTV